jgi:hypothetical protein
MTCQLLIHHLNRLGDRRRNIGPAIPEMLPSPALGSFRGLVTVLQLIECAAQIIDAEGL